MCLGCLHIPPHVELWLDLARICIDYVHGSPFPFNMRLWDLRFPVGVHAANTTELGVEMDKWTSCSSKCSARYLLFSRFLLLPYDYQIYT
ncbi:hypothetical protein PITC_039060 [Penicillium italicum]|uniref:Uncharacterized protein n=1 Tax=Penicillium italicum TaxID=40296 RepID=A0A0A2LAR1_PENIT|nr:hypothetical protein PITC_039060 [Penicillium italicum]